MSPPRAVHDDTQSYANLTFFDMAGCPLWVISGIFRGAIGMSALPPKADMRSQLLNVRQGPEADIQLTTHLKAAAHLERAFERRNPFGNQARSVPSSSFSAHFITSSSFSPPCVNFDTRTVLMARL